MSLQTKKTPPEFSISNNSRLLTVLPASCRPYAELMRLEKPVGILNISFPYLFGALFAACVRTPLVEPTWLLQKCLRLFMAALIMRCAGCTWNDVVDRDIDPLVERTRMRPIARGSISSKKGGAFSWAQIIFGAWLFKRLLQGEVWLKYVVPLVALGLAYPFAKRLVNYAQVALGIALGWGVLVGAAVVGMDFFSTDQQREAKGGGWLGLTALYLVYVVWSVIHDTVYAHQDVRDDAKAGIGSMAVRWRQHTRMLLSVLAVLQVGLLTVVGIDMGADWFYYFAAVGGNAVVLNAMIERLDLEDPENCLWWFKTGSLLVGFSIWAGLLGEYVGRLMV